MRDTKISPARPSVIFPLPPMSSSSELSSSYEKPVKAKRDRSPVRKSKTAIIDSNFNSIVFRLLLDLSNPHTIWLMANVCKHWRWMIKTFMGPQLLVKCTAWINYKRGYTQISIFYNLYQCKLICLDHFEFLRTRSGLTTSDFRGTCLSPFACSASKDRPVRNWRKHLEWVEVVKTKKKGVEIEYLLEMITRINPCYSVLKHILLKVASNSKLQSDKLITLHDMFNYSIPAKLIEAYYKKIATRMTENEFARHRMVGYDASHLDYFLAIRSIVQPLFPYEYMRALRSILRNTNQNHPDIDRIITAILESHALSTGESRFVWLSELASNYTYNLSAAELDRFVPVLEEYCLAASLAPITPSKIVIHSHQLMYCIFGRPKNIWAPRLFLWFLSDPKWFDRRAAVQFLSHLRKDNQVIPWILDSLGPYLCTLEANERFEAEQNLASFIHRMMDAGTWANNQRWERTEAIVRKFVSIAEPTSLRKWIGLIYYPHAVPRTFLNYDYHLESTDPDIIRYNFLKMRSTVK
jgi:hypothetical protein